MEKIPPLTVDFVKQLAAEDYSYQNLFPRKTDSYEEMLIKIAKRELIEELLALVEEEGDQ